MIYTCQVTGRTGSRAVFGIHEHHFIRSQDYSKHRAFYDREGIKQKTFWLWFEVHADLHSAMRDELFEMKWCVKRSDLLFNRRKYVEQSVSLFDLNTEKID